MRDKLKLYGFNNLTKALSFNIYDVCYAKSEREQKDYIAYIDEQYNSERLTKILCDVTEMIGAHVLNISKQDYDPQGASVNILITEEDLHANKIDESCNLGFLPAGSPILAPGLRAGAAKLPDEPGQAEPGMGEAGAPAGSAGAGKAAAALYAHGNGAHAHLDKSHVTVHTFPEYHPDYPISTFRVDIDVSTCGAISPLNALDYLIGSFDSDIITIDYRVRGFTRDVEGKKFYIDHDITSIQDYIDGRTLTRYDAIDVNVYQSNIFHTKLLIKEIELQNYLFNKDVYELPPKQRLTISDSLRREMIEIFSGVNIY
ncbi:MAG: adenosylmethionine decarboxylase [Clostridiales bacterium]|nr:adenosylmethionine decarboxylase [Clostridiales bacterium]